MKKMMVLKLLVEVVEFLHCHESSANCGGFQSELGYLEAKMKPGAGDTMFVIHNIVFL